MELSMCTLSGEVGALPISEAKARELTRGRHR
jgi:hypothetical protein